MDHASSARSMTDFNEEAFQAQLRTEDYPGLRIINDMNPRKAREIFNNYYQLNEEIENAGDHIKRVVKDHEKDFLQAFK